MQVISDIAFAVGARNNNSNSWGSPVYWFVLTWEWSKVFNLAADSNPSGSAGNFFCFGFLTDSVSASKWCPPSPGLYPKLWGYKSGGEWYFFSESFIPYISEFSNGLSSAFYDLY